MVEKLLLVRERLQAVYGRYSAVIKPFGRFLITFSTLLIIRKCVGIELFSDVLILAAVSFAGAWLPTGMNILLVALTTLFNLSALSLEVTLTVGILMIAMFCINYAVRPEMNLLVLLLPVCHFLKIPYAAVLIAGMTGTVLEIMPVISGTVFYYILTYIGKNANAYTSAGTLDPLQKFTQLMSGLMNHDEMWLMCITLGVILIVTRVINKLRLDYAKQIAPGAGLAAGLLVSLIGVFSLDIRISVVSLILGMAGSVLLAYAAQFILLPLNYLQTEYVQFEDDDYYYYVKAVPKMAISRPELQVKKLNIRKELENTAAIPEISAVDITREIPELDER
ncbi:MAG: hypothetical protein IJN46_10040 [Lachnospiraceae bacterium]|nr:hypothetical protein [Lachnospiraceae bacterium]